MTATTSSNGSAHPNGSATVVSTTDDKLLQLSLDLKDPEKQKLNAKFHGDHLIGDKLAPKGVVAAMMNDVDNLRVIVPKNIPHFLRAAGKLATGHGLNKKSLAPIVASMSNDSNARRRIIEDQVKEKYYQMLHPPPTYLGDAFQYRTADGKFNNAMSPHLGQAGAPYAKTVPSKTHQLGALPDPGDLFDRLMARQEGGRVSKSGLSSMLIYHATIIIHDIFRTNEKDKNISDSSSYLDLSPLYGYTMEMQKKIRDGKYKLGLLKPDTFAEDRLLRQPPGVCIMLVMYNRYHNYAATQLRRINENGRFAVPRVFGGTKLEATARYYSGKGDDYNFTEHCKAYDTAYKEWVAADEVAKRMLKNGTKEEIEKATCSERDAMKQLNKIAETLKGYIPEGPVKDGMMKREDFEKAYDAAWDKLDDDLFNTARLITCGMYIQIAIHDYLRALMGFHQWDTNFTLDPRSEIDHRNVSRGIGNQVTVEFNLMYRFHCAISVRDEEYTRKFMKKSLLIAEPDKLTLEGFQKTMEQVGKWQKANPKEPWEAEFGIQQNHNDQDGKYGEYEAELDFRRNPVTGLFDDQQMIDSLVKAFNDPISNFGPCNVPKLLKSVEIMGIMQARKWQIGTLNDFRDFFNLGRHKTFEDITRNEEVQNALRDLYDHPDKVELYPGIFCESDTNMDMDPGPSDVDSALWSAIFSDAITLVRCDRFYTTDWNTNSLTSWGMKEVTPDNDICKSSVFHRLIQRAFPGWFPYNSIQFFHPFYTTQTNARLATEQGYATEFAIAPKASKQEGNAAIFDVTKSMPSKPQKPTYLNDKAQISAILADPANFKHPALTCKENFPKCFQGIIDRDDMDTPTAQITHTAVNEIKEDKTAIMGYFDDLMQYIIKRESIAMNETTYQIDATRDFAIPVVTKYVADFLGFGHLIRSPDHPKAPYSENEIYQHITNCQVFLSYNTDETKLLRRRKAFKASMETLHGLTLNGSIGAAARWRITNCVLGTFKNDNAMTKLGYEVAELLLKNEPNATDAAAVMVLVGLDAAFNAVLAFTSVLDHLLGDVYMLANSASLREKKKKESPSWIVAQQLALKDNEDKTTQRLRDIVEDARRKSVKLPTIRVAKETKTYGSCKVHAGETVILDIFKANKAIYEAPKNAGVALTESDFLSYKATLTDHFTKYQPKVIAELGVTAMVKFFAQMRNARRGHDAQGRLKTVNIDSCNEGYSNYMAPMRMQRIAKEAKGLKEKHPELAKVYNDRVLRPASRTYLTAEWDEMIPFPSTWKIRFDGFGKSDYSVSVNDTVEKFGKLRFPDIDDSGPPFYQPRGPSAIGGTFASEDFTAAHVAGHALSNGCSLSR